MPANFYSAKVEFWRLMENNLTGDSPPMIYICGEFFVRFDRNLDVRVIMNLENVHMPAVLKLCSDVRGNSSPGDPPTNVYTYVVSYCAI